jgi:hypothetical protein
MSEDTRARQNQSLSHMTSPYEGAHRRAKVKPLA